MNTQCLNDIVRNIFIYIYILLLISCKSSNIVLVRNEKLDVNSLYSLKNSENKNYSIQKDNHGCTRIFLKNSGTNYNYCINKKYDETGKVIENTFSETKIYNSIYEGFNCELIEVRKYNSLGNLLEEEKSLSKINELPFGEIYFLIERKYFNNGNLYNAKKYEFSKSLLDVFKHVLILYMSNNLGKEVYYPPKLNNYTGYNLEFENNILSLKKTTADNKIIKNNLIKIYNKLNVKFIILKDTNENKWQIFFEKEKINYEFEIDDFSGETQLLLNKKAE